MNDDPRADLPVPNRRPEGGIRAPGASARPPAVEPGIVYEPPPPPRVHGDPAMRKDLGLVAFVLVALVLGLATWNVAGSLTSQAFAPRATSLPAAAQVPTPRPTVSPASVAPSPSPSDAPSPSPSATPKPVRAPVRVVIEPKPAAVFASERTKTWCAAAAVQIALNVNGPSAKVDTSRARQAAIHALEVRLTTRKDSRNGGAGPLGMAATLQRLGKVHYELRAFATRTDALHGSAKAIRRTGHAVILLAWRGAHAWVMTGYKADADPAVFANAKVGGAYIIDPWYPRVSNIWGRSDKPGVYQDAAEMKRNYLPWKRPEGRYPGRDGRFLALLPTD